MFQKLYKNQLKIEANFTRIESILRKNQLKNKRILFEIRLFFFTFQY